MVRARCFIVFLCVFLLAISCQKDNVVLDKEKEIVVQCDSTKVLSLVILKDYNDKVLKDVEGLIVNDSLIIIASPYIVDPSHLVIKVSTDGGDIILPDGSKVKNNGLFQCNLTQEVKIIADGLTPKQYVLQTMYSGLPILEISTPEEVAVTEKSFWIKDATMRILMPTGKVAFEGSTDIKARGNATLTHDKKSYSLKLAEKSEVLGMPKSKRWVLLANSHDKSLIRNSLGFEVSRMTNLGWTPRGEFVELVLNGVHRGNYYLCEKIKREKERVNIKDLKEGDGLTGGYILELDTHYDEAYKFMSSIKHIPYMFSDPDEVTQEQFNYIRDYISQAEFSLYDEDSFSKHEYLNYIDLDSFVDWWIAVEMTQNQEPNFPNSCFMTKDQGGKLKMGPVWDHDVYTFNSVYRLDTLAVRNALYYDKLFDSVAFVYKLKERWNVLRPLFQEYIPIFIEKVRTQIRQSTSLNYYIWPCEWVVNTQYLDLSIPYNDLSWNDSYTDWEDSIDKITSSFMKKLHNLDVYIQGLGT